VPTRLDPFLRDALVREFRRQVYAKTGYIEFPHQAEWRAATEGYLLTRTVIGPHDPLPPAAARYRVQYCDPASPPTLDSIITEDRLAIPRPAGSAHYAAKLAAYKSGKSQDLGMWATGFAGIPNALVQLVGIEYKTAEQEFSYLVDALLGANGMCLNKSKRHLYFDVRAGRMRLELSNGMVYDVKSWERKEALKGHQVTAIIACEAYQLPGLESFTTISQNLRAERGFYVWGTTCDSPWLGELHDMGHGRDPDWHCTCGSPGWTNPYTFDLNAFLRDCPTIEMLTPHIHDYPWLANITQDQVRGLMTKERFAIAWLGQLGAYAGRVYDFQRGQHLFTPDTHPRIWATTAADVTDTTDDADHPPDA
jgi:hypothetical protein